MLTSELEQLMLSDPDACAVPAYNSSLLGYLCPVFARKFPRETASAVYNLLHSCSTGLNITNSGKCPEGGEEIPNQRVGSEHSSLRMTRALMDSVGHPDSVSNADLSWL
jgi:hypothetical protein